MVSLSKLYQMVSRSLSKLYKWSLSLFTLYQMVSHSLSKLYQMVTLSV